jgi:hypothetical protein
MNRLRESPVRTYRRLAVGTLFLAANAVLGPFVLDVIRYRVTDNMLNQVIGGDAANGNHRELRRPLSSLELPGERPLGGRTRCQLHDLVPEPDPDRGHLARDRTEA